MISNLLAANERVDYQEADLGIAGRRVVSLL